MRPLTPFLLPVLAPGPAPHPAVEGAIPLVEIVLAVAVPFLVMIACAYHGVRLLRRARARARPRAGEQVWPVILLVVAFGIGACFGVSLFG